MNPLLYVFLIAMAPIVEMRGAIPVGTVLGLPFWKNFPVALVGNMLPVPFILLFIPKFLTWLEKFKPFENSSAGCGERRTSTRRRSCGRPLSDSCSS